LGIGRLLTSGQAANALEGAELIRQLVDNNPDIQIVPGGGITENNLVTNVLMNFLLT
jgi:copper homeostasis protein CutC